MEQQHLDARMTLKLNTPVLSALFPEGTEARVQLQQAVIAEFARQTARQALSDEAKDYLHQLSKEVANHFTLEQLVKQYFSGGSWNNPLKVSEGGSLYKAIAELVKTSFDQRFYELAQSAAEKATAEYLDRLDARVKYAVKQRVELLTTNAINARVTAAVEAARQAL